MLVNLKIINRMDMEIFLGQMVINILVNGKMVKVTGQEQKYGLIEFLAPERTIETRDEDIYENFAKMIEVKEVADKISISIELLDPQVAAQWINDYVNFMDTETISQIVDQMKNSITNQIRNIEFTIASKRELAQRRRSDQILRFEEASFIARQLGVQERVDTTNVVQNNQLNISTSSIPLYYRGFRALNAEKQKLEKRKTDDPFIPGLRDLQENLALLRSIKINEKNLHAMNVDQAAYPPINRIKPNRRMIVSIGTAAGVFLGIFLVFFASFVMKLKEDHSEKS